MPLLAVAVVSLVVVVAHLFWHEGRERLKGSKDLIQAASSAIGVIAVFAALYGLYQTAETQQETQDATAKEQQQAAKVQQQAASTQAEAAVSSLLQEHLKLATQYPELNTMQKPDVINSRFKNPEKAMVNPRKAALSPQYAFFASHAVFTAETIYELMQGQEDQWATPAWQNTVNVMIWRHNSYICNEAFNEDEYTDAFNKLIEDRLKPLGLCADSSILSP